MAGSVKNRAPARSKSGDFRRKAGTRVQHPAVLIVCEGYNTEYNYFVELRRSLDLDNTTVDIPRNDKGSAPISVVDYAKEKHQNGNGYDIVFCVFDRDEHESYRRALQAIEGYAQRKRDPIPMRGIPSIPCFEFWLLLHFERSDAPFGGCTEVIRSLHRHLPEYDKAGTNFYAVLLQNTNTAIQNAKWVLERQRDAGTDDPTTRVHEVVEHMRRLANPAAKGE